MFVSFALIEFACVVFSLDTQSSFVCVFSLRQFVLESERSAGGSEKQLTGVTREEAESPSALPEPSPHWSTLNHDCCEPDGPTTRC